jgi:tRNA(His) 5'-end guanylyltransferase
MKIYENFTEYNVSKIDSTTGFVIRIDGRYFSNLLLTIKQKELEELNTPFISDFVEAMQLTTRDLVKEFNASTGYTHSDEISLYFKPLNSMNDNEEDMKEHIFGGRVQKLITLISSYATSSLIKHLNNINHDKFLLILDRIAFDGKALVFSPEHEICNYFLWRSKQDCYRNFVSEIYQIHFPKKSIEKSNVDELIIKLKNEKHIDVNDYNIFLRRGTFIKRELENYKDDDNINYWRNSYVKFALPNLKCTDEYEELFNCKNYEEWEFTEIDFELSSVMSYM